jgi:hypothetical protein
MTTYQRYIEACRDAGLTNDSLLMDIEDVVLDTLDAEGYGLGRGVDGKYLEREEVYERAVQIAKAIDGRL